MMYQILLENFRAEFLPFLIENCNCGKKKKPRGGKKQSKTVFAEAPPYATTVESGSKKGLGAAARKVTSVQRQVLNKQQFAKDMGYKA